MNKKKTKTISFLQESEVGDTMSIRTMESVMDDFLMEVLHQ